MKNLLIILMGVFMAALIGCSDTVDDTLPSPGANDDAQEVLDVVEDTVEDDTTSEDDSGAVDDSTAVDDSVSESADDSADDTTSEEVPEGQLPADPTEDPEDSDGAFFLPAPIP